MNTRTHAAANTITGEVLTTNHGRHLKRRVAQIDRWNLRHGYGSGKWVFAHGSDWQKKLAAKFSGENILPFFLEFFSGKKLDLLGLINFQNFFQKGVDKFL